MAASQVATSHLKDGGIRMSGGYATVGPAGDARTSAAVQSGTACRNTTVRRTLSGAVGGGEPVSFTV
jgi:hypothetical protein